MPDDPPASPSPPPIASSARGRDRAWIAAAAGLALTFQLVLLVNRPPISGDEGKYVINALKIARGELDQVDAYMSPLFSALAAILVRAGIDPEVACRLVNLTATVSLIPATAWLAALVAGWGAAPLAAWMVATCPLVSSLGATGYSEPSAVLFLTIACALVVPRRDPVAAARARGRAALAGVLCVLAVLVRSELLPMAAAVVACGLRGARGLAARALVASALVAAAAAGIALKTTGWGDDYGSKATVALSFAARGLLRDPVTAEKTIYGLTQDGEASVDTAGQTVSIRSLFQAARRVFRLWPLVLSTLMFECASPLPLLVAPIGLLSLGRARCPGASACALALGAALPVAMASVLAPVARYLVPSIPFLMVLAAAGATSWAAGATAGAAPALAPAPSSSLAPGGRRKTLAALLLVALPLPWAVNRPLPSTVSVPTVYREIGHWMRDHLPAGRMLARPGTYVSYYAGIPEYTWIPAAPAAEVVDFARRRGARYLVVDGRLPLANRPGFDALIAGDTAKAAALGLASVHANDRPGVDRVVIYEIAAAPTDSGPRTPAGEAEETPAPPPR
jgi:hypothetical protein